jgi:hypothetical protein
MMILKVYFVLSEENNCTGKQGLKHLHCGGVVVIEGGGKVGSYIISHVQFPHAAHGVIRTYIYSSS